MARGREESIRTFAYSPIFFYGFRKLNSFSLILSHLCRLHHHFHSLTSSPWSYRSILCLFWLHPPKRGRIPFKLKSSNLRKFYPSPSPYTQNFHTLPNILASFPKFLACLLQPRGFYVHFLCQIKQDS